MTVLRIDTDRYAEAAALAATAGRALADAAVSAHAALANTGGMAGWDAMGAQWAGAYDPAARDLLVACQSLALASSDTARALTFSAGNYVSAEHIASMGISALVLPAVPDAVLEEASSHLPSAGEANPGYPPECWDIVAGLTGVIWPAGDPALLRSAAAAWRALASDLDTNVAGPTQQAMMSLDGLLAEDITLFHGRSAEISEAGGLIAQAARDAADCCESLATAVDSAHEELVHQTRVFVAEMIALTAVSAIGSFFTMGGASAITSLIGAARVAQLAVQVHQTIARLGDLTRGALLIGSRLPGAARMTAGLQTMGRSPSVRSLGGAVGRSLVTGAPRTSAALSRLAPAARIIRTRGGRILDSKAVTVALSDPTALVSTQLSWQIRKRMLGSNAARGDITDQVLAVAGRSAPAAPVVIAAHGFLKVRDRWDAATGLVGLPGTLEDRVSTRTPLVPGALAPRAAGPGRLTAVRVSPDSGPRAASNRDRRTSRPAASP